MHYLIHTTQINDEFASFKKSMTELMVKKFAIQGCSLRKEDAEMFVESTLLADSLLL